VLYANATFGANPDRPAGNATGTEKLPVPVNRSGANFSPSPPAAPPPAGNEITEPAADVSVVTSVLT
jgi:hypothetical protein